MNISTDKQHALHFLREHAGILIVCILFLSLGVMSLNQVLVYTPDSARYLVWSESLAHFEGFLDDTTPEPSRYVVHAPLYSVLLAPTAWIDSENVLPAKLLTTCMGVVLLAIVYWWTRKRIGKWLAVLLCSVLAVHPAMVLYSTQVLSDVPFAICVILFLSFIEQEISVETGKGSHLLALAVTIVCGLFLREVGLALIASCTAILVLKKHYKEAFLVLAFSVAFFVLWYVRNEVLVAGVEHPPLQNTKLFFRHLFTSSDVSLLGEFEARLKTNATIYGINILQLPFMAEVILRGISTMTPDQFPIAVILRVMPFVYHPVLILSGLFLAVGLYDEYRHGTLFTILLIFLGFYLIPILFYPINDSRFLFPPLIIELYLIVLGLRFLFRKAAAFFKRSGESPLPVTTLLALLALPGLAWTVTYVGNNWRYGKSPVGFYEAMHSEPAYPGLFARPIELAGKWIADNTDSATVLVSRWKELGIYTRGRKVLEFDPQILVESFEDLLRDYGVQYIVTVKSRGGLREYEQLFAQCDHFHFVVVKSFADLEIVKVEKGPPDLSVEVSDQDSTQRGIQLRYAKAIRELENGRPLECERLLKELPGQARKQYPVVLNIAVAKEFSGDLDVAKTMFEQFHEIQQAGSVIQPAWYHLEIISKLLDAKRNHPGVERAQDLLTAAAYYWILGFHHQSLLTFDKSIQADSAFFPPMIFRAIYSLLGGDTTKSKQCLELARHIDATNILVVDLTKVFDNLKILAHEHNRSVILTTRLDNIRLIREMGLRENAIEGLLHILAEYPDNEQALRALVDLYRQKGRYAPELEYLKRLVALRPADEELRKELNQLESRW